MTIRLKHPNLLADALYNVHTSSGASDDYAKGLVVGAMSALMAESGADFREIIPVIVEHLPISFRPDRLPEAWRADIVAEKERQINAKCKG